MPKLRKFKVTVTCANGSTFNDELAGPCVENIQKRIETMMNSGGIWIEYSPSTQQFIPRHGIVRIDVTDMEECI